MLVKNKLNSVKSTIPKAIKKCYISRKDYPFINKEVEKYKKLKEEAKYKD